MKLDLPLPPVCIFDLDGTLVNSLPDIAEALNECLDLLGLDPRPVDDYRYMVGEGVPMLCRRVLGQTHPHLVGRLTELARAAYRARPLQHTKPYPGVSQLIGRLRAANVRLGVLSNKPHDMTVRVVHAFWPDSQFAAIQGYVDDERRKPDPHYLLRMCADLGVQPAQVWLVGDTPTDVQTASRGGAAFVGVTWGFRTRHDLESAGARTLVDHPDDIC